jgi:hypothetical protein
MIAAFGRKISQDFGQRAQEIQNNTRSAEVPATSWGVLGQAIAWTAYRSTLDDFIDHLGKIRENAEKAGEKFRDTADHYRAADQANREMMDKIAQRLLSAKGGHLPMQGGADATR